MVYFAIHIKHAGSIVYVYLKCLWETSRYNFLFSIFDVLLEKDLAWVAGIGLDRGD